MTKIPIWNGSAPASTPPTWSERVARGHTNTSATHSHRNKRRQKNYNKGAQKRHSAPTKTRKDQEMGKLSTSPTQQVVSNLNVIPPIVTTQVEGINGSNTSKVKLNFNLSWEKNDSAKGKWVDLNPFEALNEENESSNFLKKTLEELEGGWTFQGKKKNKVRIDTIFSEGNQSPHPNT
jgi:hypothetical protein